MALALFSRLAAALSLVWSTGVRRRLPAMICEPRNLECLAAEMPLRARWGWTIFSAAVGAASTAVLAKLIGSCTCFISAKKRSPSSSKMVPICAAS
eukprot:2547796-Amphidinium_carterae.1